MIWGRVENGALGELYSRALVTVIPSHREEFGIVAIEAMMCGCPVVAARTGGLQDVVASGRTGTLFSPDDAALLATVLSAYLRNLGLRRVQSGPARERALACFSGQTVFSRFTKLYNSHSDASQGLGAGLSDWETIESAAVLSEARLSRLKAAFNDSGISATLVSYRTHPVFQVESFGRRFAAKCFVPRSSLQSSMFAVPAQLSSERGGLIGYARVLYNSDNPVSPRVFYAEDCPEPLIISEWRSRHPDSGGTLADQIVSDATNRWQSYRPLPDGPELRQYKDALSAFANMQDDDSRVRFDLAGAQLNSCMTGERLVLCRSHPQVELSRFRELLGENVWPLPEEFRVRAVQVINLLLNGHDIVIDAPTLAHGDPRQEHMLIDPSGNTLLADCEHSRYAVGPLDFALWLCASGVWKDPQCNAQDLCDRIFTQVQDPRERYLCICWLVAELLFVAVTSLSNGERMPLTLAGKALRDMPTTLFNRGIIQ